MILKNAPELLALGRRALLINPPIYDTQYWPQWSQPHGLLKVAWWLKNSRDYTDVRLLDCLATDSRRKVPFHHHGIVERDNVQKFMWHFGWKWEKLEYELKRHATRELFFQTRSGSLQS